MAKSTGVAWTRSSFNPWLGCTKVGPGCDHCYAEAEDARRRWGGATHWGAGIERYLTSRGYWAEPPRWDREARREAAAGRSLLVPAHRGYRGNGAWSGRPGFWPVFCASLADVFDNEVPPAWRADLWRLIEETPALTWQIVTKRIGNALDMVPERWLEHGFPSHVWIIATMVNQEEIDRDWPKLRAIPARVCGLSIEPMLGAVHLPRSAEGLLHWVILGGESDQPSGRARACHVEWIEAGIEEARAIGAAPFVKQLGSNAKIDVLNLYASVDPAPGTGKRADPAAWPERIRVQEFPT